MKTWGFGESYENAEKQKEIYGNRRTEKYNISKNRIPEKTLGVINISLEMAEGKIREPEEKSTNITKLKREKKKT